MNFVMLKGHCGQEPTIRTTDSGRKVMQFSMATTSRYKAADGTWKEESPVWHNIVAWGHLTENPVQKGNLVHVTGKISNRQYEDKDGVKRYITEVVATDVDIIKVIKKVADVPPPVDPRAGRDAQGFVTPEKVNAQLVDAGFFHSDIPAGNEPPKLEPVPF
jgi:single-strand DNA-binding protein